MLSGPGFASICLMNLCMRLFPVGREGLGSGHKSQTQSRQCLGPGSVIKQLVRITLYDANNKSFLSPWDRHNADNPGEYQTRKSHLEYVNKCWCQDKMSQDIMCLVRSVLRDIELAPSQRSDILTWRDYKAPNMTIHFSVKPTVYLVWLGGMERGEENR